MAIIKVPKTPKSAFNKTRPPSDLLKAQITHLEAAVATVAPQTRGMRSARMPRTEGQAAKRIAALTHQLASSEARALRAQPPPPAPTVEPRAQQTVRKRARKTATPSKRVRRAKAR